MTPDQPNSTTPPGRDSSTPSWASRIKDTAASVPRSGPGSGIGGGYAAGKQLASEQWPAQAAATHFGYQGNDPASHGTLNGGAATQESLASIPGQIIELRFPAAW